ncbi:ATP-binding protein [Snodgrassella communis]|uniref:ATP-binding protein n=1 Tax=Snodgrassella communis TaxID=2946699 RepID=UPI000C1F6069|nr:ATP-binding protein [Snodgrassella communis]PIT20697.1 hypothetical protein BGI35_07550 [Snodgrassella communis]
MSSSQELNSNFETTIDVSPDMQFYRLLESYPYTIKNALSEYIDNALEAFRTAKQKQISGLPDILTITINISKERIIINDNGIGIPVSEIQRAMKPASKSDKQSLSEFGIGMKAASSWFGKKWTLKSYPLDGSQPFSLEFDLNKLLQRNLDKVKLNNIEQRSCTGVEIILENLNRQIEEIQAKRIWIELQETYQLFCSRKDPQPILNLLFKYNNKTLEKEDFTQIIVANEPLKFPLCKFKKSELYVIGSDITWKRDIEFMFENKKIHGFISLGKESSQTLNPGLRLFRFGRLIKGSSEAPYRPKELLSTANKYAPSRFYAELHLDGQRISNSKGEFIFDEYLFLNELKKQAGVLDYIEQAENFRSKKAHLNDYIYCETLEEYENKSNKKQTEKSSHNNKEKVNSPENTQNHSENKSKNNDSTHTGHDKNINNDPQKHDSIDQEESLLPKNKLLDNINFSSELHNYLKSLKVNKLSEFYLSLCRISLTNDPLVAYVCAWSMLDSLKAFLSNDSTQSDFTSFYNSKLETLYPDKKDKNTKKKYKAALSEIHSRGNLCKHDGIYAVMNAQQLVNDFNVLEPLIIYCIKEKIKEKQ